MVNRLRYLRQFKDLRGPAKKAAEDLMRKRNPPFFQLQHEITLDERYVIEHPPFVDGDRVQVLKGPDRGKIGKINSVYKQGNSCFVEGLGGTREVVVPKAMWNEGQTTPVIQMPLPIPYDNLRLVSQIKHDDGSVEDVAVHSVTFKGEYYDEDRNCMMPIRRAFHDPSIVIPYPMTVNPIQKSNDSLATQPSVTDKRTFFPPSIVMSPIHISSMDQIRHPYSKWHRDRDSRRITEQEVSLYSAPEMPVTPATKKLLQEVAKLKKPRVEFTKEMEEYISSEVEKGLNKRLKEETAALENYH